MRCFRQRLKQSRVFVLSLVLVETFFLVDGRQFVYAYEVHQQKKEMALRSFADTFGIPYEDFLGEERPLFDPVLSFWSEKVLPFAGSGLSQVESLVGELSQELQDTLFPAPVQLASTSPQELGGGGSSSAEKPLEDPPAERRLLPIPGAAKDTPCGT